MLARLVMLSLLVAGSACGSTVGSGVSATETRDAEGATSLDVRMWIPTRVRTGEASEVAVTCDDNLLDEIITEVIDGVLVVREPLDLSGVTTNVDCFAVVELPAYDRVLNGASGPMTLEGTLDPLADLRATASGPITSAGTIGGLQALLGSGSGTIDLATVDAVDLEIDHSSSADLSIGALTAETVDVRTTSSGTTMLAGTATSAVVDVGGNGAFGDKNLVVEEAELTSTAAGGLEITVTERVTVTLTGSADVVIFGNPQDRTVDDTGSGDVRFE